MSTSTFFRKAILGLSGLLLAGAAHAAYPEKPIQLVLSFPPGGSTDVMARALAQGLSKELDQSVVVENKPGAGGAIGLVHAARARPDGYTFYFAASSNQAIAASLYDNQAASLVDDFEPVGLVGGTSHVLVVPATLPVNNVRELIEYIKAAPGKYNFASHGAGTLSHLESELFVKENGLDMVHVPYKGSANALPDVVNGNATMIFDSFTGSQPMVTAGKLKYLAVPTAKRISLFPDVPTLAEEGVENIEVENLFGLFAPKGTPQDIIDTVAAALERVTQDPELQKTVAASASELRYVPGPELGRIVAHEHEYWGKVVRDANAKVN